MSKLIMQIAPFHQVALFENVQVALFTKPKLHSLQIDIDIKNLRQHRICKTIFHNTDFFSLTYLRNGGLGFIFLLLMMKFLDVFT